MRFNDNPCVVTVENAYWERAHFFYVYTPLAAIVAQCAVLMLTQDIQSVLPRYATCLLLDAIYTLLMLLIYD